MTHSAQGSFDVFQLPRRWARTVIVGALIGAGTFSLFHPLDVAAQERDRIVIRGPEGAEQTDVRIGTERYGPIKATDTLWTIASQYRPHSSVDVPQMMAALVLANPEAFRNGNPSEMLTGFYLRIPSLQEVQMMNPEAARRQVQLGEQLNRQQQVLNEQQQLTNQRQEEQDKLVQETRTRTEQAIGEVRARHEQEFIDLRESLLSSIETTEKVFRDNEELRERLVRLEELLNALQEGAVTSAEYQAEISELKAAQEALRREQDIVSARTQEKTVVEELLDHPAALALLASVPALLMILLTTWLLRRRQLNISEHEFLTETKGGREAEQELSDEEAREALERELMGGITVEEDDLLSDDPFEGFDDDEGADLDRLSDEMLMPRATDESNDEADFDIRLDESAEALNESDFSELDDGFDSPEETPEAVELVQAPPAAPPQAPSKAVNTDDPTDGSLGQDDLDRLLAGATDDDSEEQFEPEHESTTDVDTDSDAAVTAEQGNTATTVDSDDIDDLLDNFAKDDKTTKQVAAKSDDLLPEEPNSIDPFDPDVVLDQTEQTEQTEQDNAESDDAEVEADDIDIDELFNELGISDESTEEITPEDIDSLLSEPETTDADDVLAGESSAADEEPELVFVDEDDIDNELEPNEEEGDELLADVDAEGDEEPISLEEVQPTAEKTSPLEQESGFTALADDEELDEDYYALDENELAEATAAAESELESLFTEDADTTDEADSFLNIDDILAETDTGVEAAADEDNDDDSYRAEDQLAAQLDLARAYLEMDEYENAREALQEVLASADEALKAEAEELLKRIDNE